MPPGYIVLNRADIPMEDGLEEDQVRSRLEEEAARQLGFGRLSDLGRGDVKLPRPITCLILAPQPKSAPRNADVILNSEPAVSSIQESKLYVCHVTGARKIYIQKQESVESVSEGGIVAFKADVAEANVFLAFEGGTAKDFTWRAYHRKLHDS